MTRIIPRLLPIAIVLIASACTTPIIRAIRSGDTNGAIGLIDSGIDVNQHDGQNFHALDVAAGYGNLPVVKALIEKGARIDIGEPLYWAAKGGHAEVAKYLIEKGVDPTRRSVYFGTPVNLLYDAALSLDADTVKLFIAKGADVDVALAALEKFADDKYIGGENKSGLDLLRRIVDSRAASQAAPASAGISKEDIKSIVQAAVESANTAKGRKSAAREGVASDIDRPSFDASQRIVSDDDVAVIVGVEGYQDLPKSDYSYDDAKLVKEYAKALGFKERNIELLLDERATKSALEKTLEAWLKNKVKEDSRVFFYYSGHGAPDPASGEAYLVPYDGDPNYLATTGYPLKRLYADLAAVPAKEVLVTLDACFSGSGGRSVLAKGARPLVLVKSAAVTAPNMAVLAATQGTQISSSSAEKGHGIFTYYFLKALKDGEKDYAGIYRYLKPRVEDDAQQINVQQSPSLTPPPDKIAGRFSLRK